MIKFKQGHIVNSKGLQSDIIVKAASPNTLRDSVIGGLMVLFGIGYLTITAFKHGAVKYEDAEMKALSDLNLLG